MHDHRTTLASARRIATGLLLLLPAACNHRTVSLGEHTGTGGDTSDSGASDVSDTGACGEACDTDLFVAHLSGVNVAGRVITVSTETLCTGAACPESVDLGSWPSGEAVEACETGLSVQDSPLDPEEYCRFSAAFLAHTFNVGFSSTIDATSYERTRPRADGEDGEESYLWFPEVVALHGPGTAFRGDYHRGRHQGVPDSVTRLVNESCAQRLTAQGVAWTEGELATLCAGTWDDDGVTRPLRLDPAMVFNPFAGELSTTRRRSCSTPDEGPDTCCSACDHALGPAVARYGVDSRGTRRNFNDGTAIQCNPEGDPISQCRDLMLDAERPVGTTHTYAWDGDVESWPLPRYDKLHETHPDARPAGLEVAGAECGDTGDCGDGETCMGANGSGEACTKGDDCVSRSCRSEWFGACQVIAPGEGACVDRRFDPSGAGACLAATADFAHGDIGDRIAQCDSNLDGLLSSEECCEAALGGGAGCDPYAQSGLLALTTYDADTDLPEETQCLCDETVSEACAEVVDQWCAAPFGSGSGPGPDSAAGGYAVPFVIRNGGLRRDEVLGTMTVRLATLGGIGRASTESCAEERGQILGRGLGDGWLANTTVIPELDEDHNLAVCSGSTYRLVFAESDAPHHVRTESGAALDGRSEFVFETGQFRVVGNSLFPSDNLRISSCDWLSFQLTNTFDHSVDNLNKIELHADAADGPIVAGGPQCDPLADEADVLAGAIPCLTMDVRDGMTGEISFSLDEAVVGAVLQPERRYHVVLPTLPNIDAMEDPQAYAAAFHDACGMPLIENPVDWELEMSFLVDESCAGR